MKLPDKEEVLEAVVLTAFAAIIIYVMFELVGLYFL